MKSSKDILFRGQEAPEGYGAYAYLIFTRRPSGKEMQRYMTVCEAYIRALETAVNFGAYDKKAIMPTYWFGTKMPNEDIRNNRLYMINKYDYKRAGNMADSINSKLLKGPLLIAWNKPFEKVEIGGSALVIDMSEFTENEIFNALVIWMEQVTRDPKVWMNGFNEIRVREQLRHYSGKYGNKIISKIDTMKK